MITFKEFAEKKRKTCPPGYRYDTNLNQCVPKFPKYKYYGRIGPGPKQEPQNTSGNGNANGNGNGNGNGAQQGGNGNGGNGGNAGNGGNGS